MNFQNKEILLKKLQVLKTAFCNNLQKNKLIIFVFILIIVNSILWNIIIPIWQTPDELAHFSYVQGLVEHKFFPLKEGKVLVSKETSRASDTLKFYEIIFDPKGKFLFNDYQDRKSLLDSDKKYRNEVDDNTTSAANYPPLYYMLCSIPYLIFRNWDLPTLFHSIRIVSAILLVITCYFVYKTTKVLKFSKSLQVTACIFVGFQPMLTMLSASVNPDNLIITLFTIFTYIIIRVLTNLHVSKLNDIYTVLVTLFLTIITKEYSIIMFALFLVFLLYLISKKKQFNYLSILKFIPIFFFIICLMLLQYKVLSMDSGVKNLTVNFTGSIFEYIKFITSKDYIDRLMINEYKSFWAVFGWLDTPINSQFYILIWFLLFVTGIGILIEIIFKQKRRVVFCIMFSYFISLVLFLAYIDYRMYSLNKGMITQGRYYLVMIAPITIMLCIGWERIRKMIIKYINFFPFLIAYCLILFNFITLIYYIYPRYYV